MKISKQKGHAMIEYILVALAIFVAWNVVDIVRNGMIEHQEEYTWAISQPL